MDATPPKDLQPEIAANKTPAADISPIPPQSALGLDKKPRAIKKRLLITICLVLLATVGAFGFLRWRDRFLKVIKGEPITQEQKQETATLENKQWINCTDIRQIIYEEGKIYRACFGGVMVIDEKTEKITNQISMADGLGDSTTTSLVKVGEILYIGTQDGFTKFNLTTREAKRISVKEGLSDGANITLALDGQNLWVGTFNGMNRYNIATGQIEVFLHDLSPASTKVSIRFVKVAPNGVYTDITAHDGSAGGIARWDKATKKWHEYTPTDFGAQSRVDIGDIETVAGKVFATVSADSNNRELWVFNDQADAKWEKLEGKLSEIGKLSGNSYTEMIGADEKGLYFWNNFLTRLNPTTLEISQIYPTQSDIESPNILRDNTNRHINNGRVWAGLRWIDLNDTTKRGEINLDRPLQFGEVKAVINDEPLLGREKLIFYHPNDNRFEELLDLPAWGTVEPIENTNNILIYAQDCGQGGCTQPEILSYDYQEKSIKKFQPNQEVLDLVKPKTIGQGYDSLTYLRYDREKGKLQFEVGQYNPNLNKLVEFDIKEYSWSISEMSNADQVQAYIPQGKKCNKRYDLDGNGFKIKESCSKQVESSDYVWDLETKDSSWTLWQIDKKTGNKEKLVLPIVEGKYSPFGTTPIRPQGDYFYADNKLWIGTDRGIGIYDPNSKTWKWMAVQQGLVSNEIDSMVAMDQVIWMTSNAGLAVARRID